MTTSSNTDKKAAAELDTWLSVASATCQWPGCANKATSKAYASTRWVHLCTYHVMGYHQVIDNSHVSHSGDKCELCGDRSRFRAYGLLEKMSCVDLCRKCFREVMLGGFPEGLKFSRPKTLKRTGG